jgi:hypothetical protein
VVLVEPIQLLSVVNLRALQELASLLAALPLLAPPALKKHQVV